MWTESDSKSAEQNASRIADRLVIVRRSGGCVAVWLHLPAEMGREDI